MSLEWHDAGLHALRAWERLSEATTPLREADALIDLANAMSDLASWLPGYDIEIGTVPEDEDA